MPVSARGEDNSLYIVKTIDSTIINLLQVIVVIKRLSTQISCQTLNNNYRVSGTISVIVIIFDHLDALCKQTSQFCSLLYYFYIYIYLCELHLLSQL